MAGLFEAVFDIAYLCTGFALSIFMLSGADWRTLSFLPGICALVLVGGDCFHLIPRIAVIAAHNEVKYRAALGRGKQITSVTMTVFYVLLWQVGVTASGVSVHMLLQAVLWILAAVRILLCLMPQNRWEDGGDGVKWGILRNIPFFLMGVMTAWLYFVIRDTVPGLSFLWLAVLLSFAFYAPVVLWSNRNKMLGMLMIPKTCMYIWILFMLLAVSAQG